MKIGTLFTKLASKAGLDITNAKYTDILSLTTELPEDDANKIVGALITLDDAKNNIDLKRHFTSAALDGADAELNRIMEEFGFEPADKEAIKAEKSTYAKITKVANDIKRLEAKKAGATGADKKELQEEINRKTSQIVEIEKNHKAEIARVNSEWEHKLIESTRKSHLAGKNYPDKNIPKDIQIEAINLMLNRKLQEVGAKVVNINGVLTLRQEKDETLDWYSPTNEKPTYEQFADAWLAENKLIAVNDPAGSGSSNGGQQGSGNNSSPVIINGDGKGNSSLVSSLDANLQALESSLK